MMDKAKQNSPKGTFSLAVTGHFFFFVVLLTNAAVRYVLNVSFLSESVPGAFKSVRDAVESKLHPSSFRFEQHTKSS